MLVGLTLLAHLIYGYMAGLSLALLLVLPNPDVPLLLRIRRLAAVAVAAFATSAFQILPLIRDGYLINHSRWEAPWKWDSFGAAPVLQCLFTGELLDFGRLPILSVLALAGLALLLWDWRQRRSSPSHSYLALGAALWILLFFGRSFWGPLLTILGISEDMHLHRVIGGAHVFLVLLAAVALARLWSELTARRMVLLAAGATALLLYPAAAERYTTLVKNGVWGRRNLESYEAERRDVDAAIASAKQRGGRAYAGLAAGWGGQFKVGDVPFHAFLSTAQVPTLGFLYHSMALTGDTMVRFVDQWPALYRLFNVRTLISPTAALSAPPGTFVERAQFGRFRVYDAPGNGYFDLVDADTAVRVTRRNIYDVNDRWLSSDWPSKRAHLLLELRDPAPPSLSRIAPDAALPFLASPAPDPGRVLDERQNGLQIYAAETEVLRPAYALFKMTWHPNWVAYVDGAPQPVRMLSPGFSGVALTPGRHRVEFRYEPGPSKPLFAFAGLLLLVFGAWRGAVIGRTFDALLVRFAAPKRLLVAAGVVALTAPVVAPFSPEACSGATTPSSISRASSRSTAISSTASCSRAGPPTSAAAPASRSLSFTRPVLLDRRALASRRLRPGHRGQSRRRRHRARLGCRNVFPRRAVVRIDRRMARRRGLSLCAVFRGRPLCQVCDGGVYRLPLSRLLPLRFRVLCAHPVAAEMGPRSRRFRRSAVLLASRPLSCSRPCSSATWR